ncbi:short-chain dehydrogenase/reductase family 16C member 6 [Diorhabda carinulata]|uniref:short-chain dehydrogenase/reductase family 16C member 6 n=1 Tax=Diorhabda carinulata TaxID=1163345 RepID=UPI0025A24356|nr:short-chain dehydrogenase/reductase family 16C member 6 [Diorhabda carinulata]
MTYLQIILSVIEYWWSGLKNITFNVTTRVVEILVIVLLAVYYFAESFILTFTPSFLRSSKDISGKVILVTGGAGGVGRELVIRLARNKAQVIVWDNNEKGLKMLKDFCKERNFHITTYDIDITEKELVYKYANIIKQEFGPVDILINNAGIVCGQTLLDIPDHMIEKTFKVNIISHYWTVKAFLPDMIKQKSGHIVTVGSLTGFLGTYKCTDYSATKFATIGFHESLMYELKTDGHHKIKTTIICPYFINTGMFEGCKPRNFPMLEPKDVAKRIITAIKREETLVTMPACGRFLLPAKNYLPAKLTWAIIIKIMKLPQSMMGLRSFNEVEAA